MATTWSTEAGDLVLAVDGRVARRGLLEDRNVMKVAGLRGTEDALVLLDYSDGRRQRRDANLIRVRPDLSIAWRAKPPDPDDTAADEWVHFTLWKSERLTANSGSGYYCRVNVTTGVVEHAEFVK